MNRPGEVVAQVGNFISRKRAEIALLIGGAAVATSGCGVLKSDVLERTPKEGEVCIIQPLNSNMGAIDQADEHFDGDSLIRGAGSKMAEVAREDKAQQRLEGISYPAGRYALCKMPGMEDIRVLLPSQVEDSESLGELIEEDDPRYDEFFTPSVN